MSRKKRYQIEQGAPEAAIPPSRSQLKRESTALQAMGTQLAALSPAQFAKAPISPNILAALREYPSITSHEGRRRHMQYIGRLMREEADAVAVQAFLDSLDAAQREELMAAQHITNLRTALLEADADQLEKILREDCAALLEAAGIPHSEQQEHVQKIALLVAQAKHQADHTQPPHASRALFRFLRSFTQPHPHS